MKLVLLQYSEKLFLVKMAVFPDQVWYETEILEFYLFLFHLPVFLVHIMSRQLSFENTYPYDQAKN